MVDTIDVPANDHFQVITEHDHDGFVYYAGYLGIARSDGVIIIQITLSEDRTAEFTVICCRVAHLDKDPEYPLELPEYVQVVEPYANAWH